MEFVTYYRVNNNSVQSEKLMDRQWALVHAMVGESNPLAEFVEVDQIGGKRPELRAAIKLCKSKKAVLVIARSRGLQLPAGQIKIICLDFSNTPLLPEDLPRLAQFHRDQRSQAAARGMLGAKASGRKLGAQNEKVAKGRDQFKSWLKASAAASISARAGKRDFYELLQPDMEKMRSNGFTLDRIAQTLNGFGYLTAVGKQFTPTAVKRILDYDKDNKKQVRGRVAG